MIYLAAPLFNPTERRLNEEVCQRLEELGYKVYLPQRDGGRAELGDSVSDLYKKDVEALNKCNMCVAILQGETLDPGTVFELGYLAAQDKPIFAYRNDWRAFSKGQSLNLMISESCQVYEDLEDIYEDLTND